MEAFIFTIVLKNDYHHLKSEALTRVVLVGSSNSPSWAYAFRILTGSTGLK